MDRQEVRRGETGSETWTDRKGDMNRQEGRCGQTERCAGQQEEDMSSVKTSGGFLEFSVAEDCELL